MCSNFSEYLHKAPLYLELNNQRRGCAQFKSGGDTIRMMQFFLLLFSSVTYVDNMMNGTFFFFFFFFSFDFDQMQKCEWSTSIVTNLLFEFGWSQ